MELRKLNTKLMFMYLEPIEQLSKDPTNIGQAGEWTFHSRISATEPGLEWLVFCKGAVLAEKVGTLYVRAQAKNTL
ncbi:hypothetical protein EV182_001086 [Spiromyces aspiralis]|uniref:Uncharacterized protein n=1 Tax=Spiromyces aspiralis TaxID=68401 RepID=A0ACC1HV55_9FUNG|nr:hypothetical protein EV182_001086 [Spiromyces aspiralis]